MQKPLVSILIPVYNREKLIVDTIRSALDQDYENFEVVVVDNCSTDDTWERIKCIAALDSRVRAFRNDSNIGPVKNWIECAKHARGTLSKILWSDDLISPNYLSRTVSELDDPRIGFVYTSVKIFKEGQFSNSEAIHYNHLRGGIYKTIDFIQGSLLDVNFPVSPGCFLLRTHDLRKFLFADIPNAIGSDFKSHAIGNDLLLLLLIANNYERFSFVSEPLSMFRDHSGSISTVSGVERLIVHYAIAKAYFVQCSNVGDVIRRRFNTVLWLQMKRFDFGPFGIRRLQDFYFRPADTSIDIKFFFARIVRRFINFRIGQEVTPFRSMSPRLSMENSKVEGGRYLTDLVGSTPRLSIITVVYNGAELISSTIESVLRVKSPDVEYIVIDGGSTDGTVDCLRSYGNRIEYWVSEPDAGIYDAMNKALAIARGSYIYHLNVGDQILCIPKAIFEDVPPSVAGIACRVKLDEDKLFKPSVSLILRLHNSVHHQGCFYNSCAPLVYDTQYHVFSDFDLNQRLMKYGLKFELSDETVAYHSGGGVSHNRNRFHEVFDIVRKNYGLFWLVLSFIYFKLRGFIRKIGIV